MPRISCPIKRAESALRREKFRFVIRNRTSSYWKHRDGRLAVIEHDASIPAVTTTFIADTRQQGA